jgi:glycosyltransferase involved in cell wall biosynthesis
MANMKIALVVPGGVDRTGEYRVIPALLSLIARLARHHELHVYALAQEAEPGSWELAGARIHNVGARQRVARMIGAIRHEHRRGHFEVIHSMWSGACGVVCMFSARLLGVPNIVHLTGGELVSLPDIGYGAQRRLRWRILERLILRSASLVTVTSAPIAQEAARLGVRARRIPLGIDLDTWPARDPVPRRPEDTPRLMHIASLNRVKDQDTLLRAICCLREQGYACELDIVGEDTLGGEVQRLAVALGIGAQVRFHGFLTHRQLRPLVEQAHINLVSSRHEAGPFVLLECASLGIPTVGTAVGHLTEWAPAAALTASVGDPAGLAAGIARLIDDEPLRQRIGHAALLRARREDADFTAAQFELAYREIT